MKKNKPKEKIIPNPDGSYTFTSTKEEDIKAFKEFFGFDKEEEKENRRNRYIGYPLWLFMIFSIFNGIWGKSTAILATIIAVILMLIIELTISLKRKKQHT